MDSLISHNTTLSLIRSCWNPAIYNTTLTKSEGKVELLQCSGKWKKVYSSIRNSEAHITVCHFLLSYKRSGSITEPRKTH